MPQEIEPIPDGTYAGGGSVDSDCVVDEPPRIAMLITKTGGTDSTAAPPSSTSLAPPRRATGR